MRATRLALLALCVSGAAVSAAPLAVAAESIPAFSSEITVQADASLAVTETVTYDFADTAGRHGIYRDIPLSFTTADGRTGAIAISGVSAADEAGRAYQVALSRSGGVEHIRIGDPAVTVSGVHTYVIRYTVIGAVTPYQDFDEVYWNATGDQWQVPIEGARATVALPAGIATSSVRAACYAGPRGSRDSCGTPAIREEGGMTAVAFPSVALGPGEGLTLAVGFPKGLVAIPPPVPWWREWLLSLIASALLAAALAFAIAFARHDRRGRGVVIPIYEPPARAEGEPPLRPAEADVLVHGRAGRRAWPATVVDLAVRGYLAIAEDTPLPLWKNGGFWLAIFAVVLLLGVSVPLFILFSSNVSAFTAGAFLLMIFVVPFAFIMLRAGGWRSFNPTRADYLVSRTARGADGLEAYEQSFLDAILDGGVFSTRALRKDSRKAQTLYYAVHAVEGGLRAETASDSSAYALGPAIAGRHLAWALLALIAGGCAAFFVPAFAAFEAAHLDGAFALGISALAAFVALYPIYLKPRLNRAGALEREAWLGFALYLETAEKYRLADLTPERFNAFLPYAMVFGVEKKWAKAFAGITMPPPSWYSGQAAAGAFSASAFTSNFSAGFSAAFASSGASGASGGGGGAGGGAGGGGGGGW